MIMTSAFADEFDAIDIVGLVATQKLAGNIWSYRHQRNNTRFEQAILGNFDNFAFFEAAFFSFFTSERLGFRQTDAMKYTWEIINPPFAIIIT